MQEQSTFAGKKRLKAVAVSLLPLVGTDDIAAESNHHGYFPKFCRVLARFCAPALPSPCWCTVTDRCQDWPWPYRAQTGHADILQAQGPRTGCLARTPSGLPTRKPSRAQAEEDCSGGRKACRFGRDERMQMKGKCGRASKRWKRKEMRQVAALGSLRALRR